MANKGIRYPFRIRDGAPNEAEDETLVASALTLLFSQERGERPYAPENGVSVLPYVFENESALVQSDVRREVIFAVSRNEPRVETEAVPVKYSAVRGQRILDIQLYWLYQGRRFSVSRSRKVAEEFG